MFVSIFLDNFSFQVVQFQLWVDWKRVEEEKIRQSMSAECAKNSEKVGGKVKNEWKNVMLLRDGGQSKTSSNLMWNSLISLEQSFSHPTSFMFFDGMILSGRNRRDESRNES